MASLDVLHLLPSLISAEVRLQSDLITRCAGSLISLTWPPSQVPVLLRQAYRRQPLSPPPPTRCISIHQNKQAALLKINKEIKLPLRSQAN